MDSPTQPTFLPHEAVSSSPVRRESGGLPELIFLISILLLIISGALAAGVFLYTQYLETSNQSKDSQLSSAEKAFNPSLVQQLTRLDTRMSVAQTLLDAHLAPSQLFVMLNQSTVQDVSFTSLNYSATGPDQITLTMTGLAGSVNSIALQAQVFTQSGEISNPIFSNIDAQSDGVHFDFSALVDASKLKYEALVGGSTAAAPATTPVSAQPAQSPAVAPFEGTSTPTQP